LLVGYMYIRFDLRIWSNANDEKKTHHMLESVYN